MRRRASTATGRPSLPDRLAARAARRATAATGFVSQPDPRSIGLYARGKQILSGNILLAGFLAEAPGTNLWDIPPPDPAFGAEAQGFSWMDDLAALGSPAARSLAQDWTWGWIARYDAGSGAGWTPDLTGRRIIRWIHHAIFLLQGRDKPSADAYYLSLSRQAAYLARRWKAARPGLPRFEALTGLIYAGLSLNGMERHVPRAAQALARECEERIDPEGGIPTRCPEELLEVLTLLTWAATALSEAGRSPQPGHLAAIERIAPTLRALRHADGGLARFHGGGRGLEGRLDQALAAAGGKATTAHGLAMGFVRMAAGRTTVIMDAARPPQGRASGNAHASTLAFELTSGRRPLIVNCGSGAAFGPDWHRAGRATPSHSTLGVEGFSSSRLAADGPMAGGARGQLTDGPDFVRVQQTPTADGTMLIANHDGYAATHGMTHIRQLRLSLDGRTLHGEDTLGAMSSADRRRFETIMDRTGFAGIDFSIRFHLHPDVDAALDLGGTAVSLALKSGEIWIFRHDGVAQLALAPSVYLEKGRLKPRASRQIVLSASVLDYAFQTGWTLSKAQDTPTAIRDTGRDDDDLTQTPDEGPPP